MTQNWSILNRRNKQWRQCLERAFGAYPDLFTALAPTLQNDSDLAQYPNASITAHPPGQPNNPVYFNVSFTDFSDPDYRDQWDEIAARHVESFVKIFKKRHRDADKLEEARKLGHLP